MTPKDNLKESFSELSADGADIAIDLLTDSKIFEAVPVAGLAIKIGKALRSVPDVIFLNKVGRFLKSVNESTTKAQRIAFAEDLKMHKNKKDQLYSSIFLKIDKFDEITKADSFAKIFSCFITNRIREEDFSALSSALNLAGLEDLMMFSKSYWELRNGSSGNVVSDEPRVGCVNLLSTKLVTFSHEQKLNTRGDYARIDYSIKFEITELGLLFLYVTAGFEDYFRFANESDRRTPRDHAKVYVFSRTFIDRVFLSAVQEKFPLSQADSADRRTSPRSVSLMTR